MFKIGDKVKYKDSDSAVVVSVRKGNETKPEWDIYDANKKYIISFNDPTMGWDSYGFLNALYVREDEIQLITSVTSTITTIDDDIYVKTIYAGLKTIVLIYDKSLSKKAFRGVSKCNPDDKYNREYGFGLAFHRAMIEKKIRYKQFKQFKKLCELMVFEDMLKDGEISIRGILT